MSPISRRPNLSQPEVTLTLYPADKLVIWDIPGAGLNSAQHETLRHTIWSCLEPYLTHEDEIFPSDDGVTVQSTEKVRTLLNSLYRQFIRNPVSDVHTPESIHPKLRCYTQMTRFHDNGQILRNQLPRPDSYLKRITSARATCVAVGAPDEEDESVNVVVDMDYLRMESYPDGRDVYLAPAQKAAQELCGTIGSTLTDKKLSKFCGSIPGALKSLADDSKDKFSSMLKTWNSGDFRLLTAAERNPAGREPIARASVPITWEQFPSRTVTLTVNIFHNELPSDAPVLPPVAEA